MLDKHQFSQTEATEWVVARGHTPIATEDTPRFWKVKLNPRTHFETFFTYQITEGQMIKGRPKNIE
jgi:hypothetical protein